MLMDYNIPVFYNVCVDKAGFVKVLNEISKNSYDFLDILNRYDRYILDRHFSALLTHRGRMRFHLVIRCCDCFSFVLGSLSIEICLKYEQCYIHY